MDMFKEFCGGYPHALVSSTEANFRQSIILTSVSVTAQIYSTPESDSRHFGAFGVLQVARDHRKLFAIPARPKARQLLAD